MSLLNKLDVLNRNIDIHLKGRKLYVRRHFIYLVQSYYLMHIWAQGQRSVILVLDGASKPPGRVRGEG